MKSAKELLQNPAEHIEVSVGYYLDSQEDRVNLVKRLPSFINMQILHFDSTDISDELIANLVLNSSQCQKIKTIKFTDYGMSDIAAQRLSSLLLKMTFLQELHFSCDSYYWRKKNNIGAIGFCALIQAIPLSVETLHLSDLSFMSNHINELAVKIKNCTQLHKLHLSSDISETESDQTIALFKALQNCRLLQSLILSRIMLTANSVIFLAKMLEHFPELYELRLEGMNISAGFLMPLSYSFSSKLKILSLNYNMLGGGNFYEISSFLKRCETLEILELITTKINAAEVSVLVSSLPSDKLQELHLSNNQLDDTGLCLIASLLPRCRSLIKLDLGGNCPGTLGTTAIINALFFCRSLQILWFDVSRFGLNVISFVPPIENPQVHQLRYLYLPREVLDPTAIKSLAMLLLGCSNLIHLFSYANNIGDDGIECLAPALRNCRALKELNFTQCKIGDQGAKFLADLLSQSKISNLDLRNNLIGNEGVTALMNVLDDPQKTYCSISIELTDNINITPAIIPVVAKKLASLRQYTYLYLSLFQTADQRQRFYSPLMNTLMQYPLIEAIKIQGQLRYYHRENTELTLENLKDDQIPTILELNGFHDRLESFNLLNAKITVRGATLLAQYLSTKTISLHTLCIQGQHTYDALNATLVSACRTTLQKLHISHNTFDLSKIISLALALENCAELTTLDLSHNGLGIDECSMLLMPLTRYKKLEIFNFSGNRFKRLEKLMALLRNFPELKELALSDNNIGDEDIKFLAAELIYCRSLTTLYLEENNITNEGGLTLAKVLPNYSTSCLTHIFLRQNKMTQDGVAAIRTAATLTPWGWQAWLTKPIVMEGLDDQRVEVVITAARPASETVTEPTSTLRYRKAHSKWRIGGHSKPPTLETILDEHEHED